MLKIEKITLPMRLARHTWLCPCFSLVPEGTHKASQGTLKGAAFAQGHLKKPFKGTRQRQWSCMKGRGRIAFPWRRVTDLLPYIESVVTLGGAFQLQAQDCCRGAALDSQLASRPQTLGPFQAEAAYSQGSQAQGQGKSVSLLTRVTWELFSKKCYSFTFFCQTPVIGQIL